MKHELIKTDDYLLVVNDEDIKEGGFQINHLTNKVSKRTDNWLQASKENCSKIIAHLPLNGAPYLNGVDVLPEIENEVDLLEVFDMACDLLLEVMSKNPPPREEAILRTNQIKELNQPKLPISFECGMEQIECPDNKPGCLVAHFGQSKIINSEGRTEWVGKYLF
jgi:hypothetical protein